MTKQDGRYQGKMSGRKPVTTSPCIVDTSFGSLWDVALWDVLPPPLPSGDELLPWGGWRIVGKSKKEITKYDLELKYKNNLKQLRNSANRRNSEYK